MTNYSDILKMNGCEAFKKFLAAFDEALGSMCTAHNETNADFKSAFLSVAKAKFELAAKFYKVCDEDIRKALAEFEEQLDEEGV